MEYCRFLRNLDFYLFFINSKVFFYGMYEVIPQKFHHLWRAVYAFRYKKKFHSVTGITCGAFFFGENRIFIPPSVMKR